MERDKAGEETTDPAGPGGLPDLGYGSRFQAGYFLSPTGRWDGVGGGSYCCSGFRTGPRATLVPLLHGDSVAALGEPVGPQGFLR